MLVRVSEKLMERDGDKGPNPHCHTSSVVTSSHPLPSCTICDPVTDAYPSYFHIRKPSHMSGTGRLGAH